jgi:cytoskeletal protein CcmA (bactofilin family)
VGLFGAKPDAGASAPPSPVKERREPTVASSPAHPATIIGKDAFIKGELRSTAEMIIEGRVEGEVHGVQVTVGDSGDVHARIEAQVLIVRGTVHGDCEGTKKVEITSSGKVFGNITSTAIVVAEGATFRGASKMTPREPAKMDSLADAPREPAAAPATPSASPPIGNARPTSAT